MSASGSRLLLLLAAFAGASGVLIGAFGAHGLPDYLAGQDLSPEKLDRRLDQFDVAARYHLVHAVALLGVAALRLPRARQLQACGILFALGIVFFSGSLYLLVATDTPWLGAVTPIGGVLWIIAWTLLGITAGLSDPQRDGKPF